MQKLIMKLLLLLGCLALLCGLSIALSIATMYFGYGIAPKNVLVVVGISLVNFGVALLIGVVNAIVGKESA